MGGEVWGGFVRRGVVCGSIGDCEDGWDFVEEVEDVEGCFFTPCWVVRLGACVCAGESCRIKKYEKI